MPREVAARRLGRLSAEERARALVDDGALESIDALGVVAAVRAYELEGFVASTGQVGGRRVLVLANDRRFTRGTYGALVTKVLVQGLALAREHGMPVVLLLDSDGVRVEEGLDAVFGVGDFLRALAETSGHVPLIAAIFGVASGAAAYAAALCDVTLAVANRSFAFVAGPAVVGAAIGESTGLDALGGTRMHSDESGFVHATAPDDGSVITRVRDILAFLPSSASELPVRRAPAVPELTGELAACFPADRRFAYDVELVIRHLVDAGTYLPLGRTFGPSIQVGFARIDGRAVALIASQPRAKSGALDADASQKLARFVRFAAAFNLPVVTLCDTPGFLPGRRSERGRILVHGAKVIAAYSEASRTVPLYAFVLRRAIGAGSVLMFGADTIFALPGYELLAMGNDAGRALGELLGQDDTRAVSRREPVTVVEPPAARAALAGALASARPVIPARAGERKLALIPL